MILPPKFEADLQSKTLHIITRVEIGNENKIYLSTHSINFDGNYYKPLLLKIPSMKESVDHESRNFKISNVSLEISNYEYNGERFSDSLKDNPLINEECNIYWQTQTASSSSDVLQVFKGYVRRVTHNDSTIKIQLEDLTQLKLHKPVPVERTSSSWSIANKYKDVPIPMAFGYLDKAPAVFDSGRILKADSDDSVSLVYGGDYPIENYEPHPVWGDFSFWDVPGLPLFDWGSVDTVTPVMMQVDDALAFIPMESLGEIVNEESGEVIESGTQQYEIEDVEQSGTAHLKPIVQKGDAPAIKVVQGIIPAKPSDITCNFRSPLSWGNYDGLSKDVGLESGVIPNDGESGWDTTNRFIGRTVDKLTDNSYDLYDLYDLNYSYPLHDNIFDYTMADDYGEFTDYFSPQAIIRVSIKSDPQFSYTALGYRTLFAINGFVFDQFYPIAVTPYGLPGDSGGIVQIFSRTFTDEEWGWGNLTTSYWLGGASYIDGANLGNVVDLTGKDYRSIFDFTYWAEPDTHADYRGNPTLTDGAIRFAGLRSISTASNPDELYTSFTKNYFVRITETTKDLGEINLSVGVLDAAGPYIGGGDLTFEGKLKGDWGEIDLLHVADLEFKDSNDFYLSVNGRTEDGNIIYNPITIMRNIAINELGLTTDQIDNDSYIEARDVHSDLKFGFSVNKEIESKKLFEDIAKSTLCYPYFKNDGKLTFASYKVNYDIDDHTNARIVKDEDVINFSFNKTKAEQAYTMVEFKYNYNYVTEEYENTFFSGLHPNPDELAYNGYEDIKDNVLKFESKYVRDSVTADKIWKRMFRFYKNQHLTCKLKLPLNYIDVEVGDSIRFDKLLGGMKAFGIDYTQLSKLVASSGWDTSAIYPLFFVTAVNKNLDSIEIEAQQIHTFDGVGNGWGVEDSDDVEEEGEWGDPPVFGEDEFNPDLFVPSFEMESINHFLTVHEPNTLLNTDIFSWSQPSAFGLDSFNSLLPDTWDNFNGSMIREYEALKFSIRVIDDTASPSEWIIVLRLKNISESNQAHNFEFGWTQEILHTNGSTFASEGQSTSFFDGNESWIVNGIYSPHWNVHKLEFGEGLNRAIQFSDVNLDGLTFYPGIDVVIADTEHQIGDPNGDGTVNILDVVAIVNYIQGTGDLEFVVAADTNLDGTINILDIVVIINYILGTGDLG